MWGCKIFRGFSIRLKVERGVEFCIQRFFFFGMWLCHCQVKEELGPSLWMCRRRSSWIEKNLKHRRVWFLILWSFKHLFEKPRGRERWKANPQSYHIQIYSPNLWYDWDKTQPKPVAKFSKLHPGLPVRGLTAWDITSCLSKSVLAGNF